MRDQNLDYNKTEEDKKEKEDLKKIENKTTVAKIKETTIKTIYKNELIKKNPYLDREDCYTPEYKEQIDLKNIENYWNNKWDSFNGIWSHERQLYKYFYDSFRLFYYSFYQLRENKRKLFIPGGVSIKMGRQECNLIEQLIGVNSFGVYMHGKKCIDLIKELKLLKCLNEDEKKFIEKFSKTRNWIFEHNFNPHDSKEGLCLSLDPLIWSMKSDNNCLEVNVHSNNSENKFQLIFSYEDDYFQLELILEKIIKSFC